MLCGLMQVAYVAPTGPAKDFAEGCQVTSLYMYHMYMDLLAQFNKKEYRVFS